MIGGQTQHISHQKGQAHHRRPHDEETGQRCQKEQPEHLRTFFQQKIHAFPQILPQYLPDLLSAGPLLMGKADEAFQQGRQEKAGRTHGKHGPDAECRIKEASQKGRDQSGDCLDLADRRISLQQIFSRLHLRHTCLHRRRFKGSENSQNHLQDADEKQRRSLLTHHMKASGFMKSSASKECEKNRRSRKRIQRHHHVSPVQPVREQPPDGRKEHLRHRGHCQKPGKNGRRARSFQHIHGKGELQRIVPDQGTDLSQQKQDKISVEKLFFHLSLHFFRPSEQIQHSQHRCGNT